MAETIGVGAEHVRIGAKGRSLALGTCHMTMSPVIREPDGVVAFNFVLQAELPKKWQGRPATLSFDTVHTGRSDYVGYAVALDPLSGQRHRYWFESVVWHDARYGWTFGEHGPAWDAFVGEWLEERRWADGIPEVLGIASRVNGPTDPRRTSAMRVTELASDGIR